MRLLPEKYPEAVQDLALMETFLAGTVAGIAR
jgi:hypothetical protein